MSRIFSDLVVPDLGMRIKSFPALGPLPGDLLPPIHGSQYFSVFMFNMIVGLVVYAAMNVIVMVWGTWIWSNVPVACEKRYEADFPHEQVLAGADRCWRAQTDVL